MTHQKRASEIADALYGVSMRGDGEPGGGPAALGASLVGPADDAARSPWRPSRHPSGWGLGDGSCAADAGPRRGANSSPRRTPGVSSSAEVRASATMPHTVGAAVSTMSTASGNASSPSSTPHPATGRSRRSPWRCGTPTPW
ncbi:hypothetical protein QJS66_00995 [Kocuria rhizophila]|nr:hypothetical protein QJS66_00995 [Kocuria rhizophila]